MKRNLLIGLVILFFMPMAYAEFSLYSTTGSCESVPGHWLGRGKASSWLLGTCKYHGWGTIAALDSTGHFTLNVSADKDSGSFVCPNHASEKLQGVCVNGVVTIMTDYGSLKGSFSQDSGDAKGKLTVSPGMEANISLQFQRG